MVSRQRALLMLVITMVIWGSTFVVTKGVIAEVPPFTLAFLRVAIGAAALSLAAALRRTRVRERSVPPSVPRRTIFLLGFVGVALYYGLFNLALVYTSASQGALVQSGIPAVTALVAAAWLRERPSTTQWLGIALSIAGIIVIFAGRGSDPDSSVLGGLLMFGTTLCWGVYTSLGKQVADADPLELTAGLAIAGAMLLLPLAVLELAEGDLPRATLRAWAGIVYLGVLPSGLAYMFYNAALKHVDASEAGVYTNLIPIVGVFSGIVLGEPLALQALAGGCIVLLGVWLTSRKGRATA